jgi:UDPglucose 6-dehydrogenase
MIMKKIGIIGSGVVGSATGKGFHRLGHDVLFYDIAKQRLLTLKEEGYQIASSVKDIIDKTDISFVCVNTPNNSSGEQDLSQLMSVLYDITNSLRRIDRRHEQQQHPHLIVFRSTMLPGTMRSVVINYFQTNCSSSSIGRDYNVCYNPEFLRQNTAFDDFFRPDRVVIGEDGKGASQPLKEIYQQLTENIIVTSFEAAEMIKYTSIQKNPRTGRTAPRYPPGGADRPCLDPAGRPARAAGPAPALARMRPQVLRIVPSGASVAVAHSQACTPKGL